MNKYRSIKKYDKVVCVSNGGNDNMIIVSQIQKNDRLRKKVLLGASFSASQVELLTYILRRPIMRSWTNTDQSRSVTEPWACQMMKTRIWLSWVEYTEKRQGQEEGVRGRILFGVSSRTFNLPTEKADHEIMNKYRSIKQRMPDDENENMINRESNTEKRQAQEEGAWAHPFRHSCT